MPVVINPRGVGSSWGTRLAIMAGRVLPPGGVEQTHLVWPRCEDSPRCGAGECLQAARCLASGPFLVCSRCRDNDGVFAGLTIIGPLTAPIEVMCGRCGGTDAEVQADIGVPPGYTEAMSRIAEWNATIDRRSERRTQCVTPFDWLPLWHPGASWQR